MQHPVELIVENGGAIPEYLEQLAAVFGDAVAVKAYRMDDPAAYGPQHTEVVLTSAMSAAEFPEVRRSLLRRRTVVSLNLSLQRRTLAGLDAFPKGTRIAVVNVTKFMAEEVIAQLCQAGYGHLQFFPYYPGCPPLEGVELAVTPGEPQLIPPWARKSMDLGPRLIDIATIVELADRLDCAYLLRTRRFFDFFARQYTTSAGVSILVEQNEQLAQRLSGLIQLYGEGMVGLDAQGAVFDCNYRAAQLLGIPRDRLLELTAQAFLPQELLDRCRIEQLPATQAFPKAKTPYLLRLQPVTQGLQYQGALAVLEPLEGAEPPRRNPTGGHTAKYRFADICGGSPQLRQTVELARKMARTDAAILLTGESGTGKELFAHAIHNASRRAQGPFVAVNCAALPENLLESELFGYEEGAFTGAKKGGKAGLFELADTGSIFLDEIEGMSPAIQLKLLRVIQEREIMRVGGGRVIPIDVRVISATNQDLAPLMETGRFRRDLYYRVGTLPLNLPPLRRRREDILPLVEQFKGQLGLTFVLTEEARQRLLHYPWPGNIRELRNCVEYLGCQNLPVLDVENLPYPLLHQEELSGLEPQWLRDQVVRALMAGPCGRGQLAERLARMGYPVTQGQLRRQLSELKELGWVESGAGRGGSRLTAQGIAALQNGLK